MPIHRVEAAFAGPVTRRRRVGGDPAQRWHANGRLRPGMFRLTSAADFERVRREGRSHAHPLVVLIARRRPEGPRQDNGPALSLPTRCGFAAGKSVGTAVVRNRAKRLLREAVRKRATQLVPGWDLIFIARAPLAKVKLGQAQEAVDNLLRRANVVSMDETGRADRL